MSTVNTNEEEQPDCAPPKKKGTAIRDDFPGTAVYVENNWDLLLYDGQDTLIDNNMEELIGWATHMDGPCAPKKPPSMPDQRVFPDLPAADSAQTAREEEEEKQDEASVSSSLSGSHGNDETVTEAGKSSTENGSSSNHEQGTKKRKRSRRAKANKLSFLDFSSSLSPSNMLRALPNTPIRPSVMHYLRDRFVEIMEKDNAGDKDESELENKMCWESLDTSALVALGIIVEEMTTAALIPLAEMHVHRCRHIIDQHVSSEEWTLPPIEAIMKLMASQSPSYANPLGSVPTTRVPSRISKEITDPDSCRQVIPAWLSKHNTDLEQVQNLWYLYKHFLPSHLEPIHVTKIYKKRTGPNKNRKQATTTNEDKVEDIEKEPENEELLGQDPVGDVAEV